MPAPTNTSAATATDLGTLPASTSQNVHDAGTTYTVWYKYTAQAGENEISVFGFGDLVTYKPTNTCWTGPAGAPTAWVPSFNTTGQNKPIQIPVVPGQTYFFEFVRNSPTASPAVLLIEAYSGPTEAAEPGDLLVNDDTGDYPAALVDGTTGEVKRFYYPFPAGEAGDILPTGEILVSDEFTDFDLKLYDRDFVLIQDGFMPSPVGSPQISAQRSVGVFYAGDAGSGGTDASIITVTPEGTQGGTTWTLPQAGLTALAANNDESILYVAGQGGSSGSPVKRWDLNSSTMLSDLVAGETSHVISDIIVLADGTLLVSYFKSSVTRAFFVRHYDTSGATLNTYTIGGSNLESTKPRINVPSDDSTFWAFYHPTSPLGFAKFERIRVSDGSSLTTLTVTEYEGGRYSPATTATPATFFGISASCPFFVMQEPPPTIDLSEECCPCDCPPPKGPKGSPTSAPLPSHTGPILPPVDPLSWIPLCAGGGDVPTAADATDPESWVQ